MGIIYRCERCEAEQEHMMLGQVTIVCNDGCIGTKMLCDKCHDEHRELMKGFRDRIDKATRAFMQEGGPMHSPNQPLRVKGRKPLFTVLKRHKRGR